MIKEFVAILFIIFLVVLVVVGVIGTKSMSGFDIIKPVHHTPLWPGMHHRRIGGGFDLSDYTPAGSIKLTARTDHELYKKILSQIQKGETYRIALRYLIYHSYPFEAIMWQGEELPPESPYHTGETITEVFGHIGTKNANDEEDHWGYVVFEVARP